MKLHHVCLKTRSIEIMKSFYCTVFECNIIHVFSQKETYGYLLEFTGGGHLEILNSSAAVRVNDPGLAHFCVQVADIYEFAGKCSRKNIHSKIKRGRTDSILSFEIFDPDSNKIEIQQIDKEAKYTEVSGSAMNRYQI